jgi:hypothetical protein
MSTAIKIFQEPVAQTVKTGQTVIPAKAGIQ